MTLDLCPSPRGVISRADLAVCLVCRRAVYQPLYHSSRAAAAAPRAVQNHAVVYNSADVLHETTLENATEALTSADEEKGKFTRVEWTEIDYRIRLSQTASGVI